MDVGQAPAAHVLVHKGDGEGLYTDHPAFVAEWAVEAIALVRRHLHRASNGMVELPYENSWLTDAEEGSTRPLPVWASQVGIRKNTSSIDEEEAVKSTTEVASSLRVTDLNLMMSEVSGLVNVMEDIMMLQRQRRLERMRAPGWMRRNWYLVATIGPATGWLVYKGFTSTFLSTILFHVRNFVKERLTDPFMAM